MKAHLSPGGSRTAGQLCRWAIVGTGPVAGNFAAQLRKIEGAELYAVVSRSPGRARAFAEVHRVTRSYDAYPDLLADPQVDVVYLATPTHLHATHCAMALERRKAVLCEKPFTRSESECRQVVDEARDRRVFCMEAMWMRFNPILQRARELLKQGHIGVVRAVRAEAGFSKDLTMSSSREEAKGAMLVFGCYGVSLAHYLFGRPDGVCSHGYVLPNGVDQTCFAGLRYPEMQVSLVTSVAATLSNEAAFYGDSGNLLIESPFFNPTRMKISNRIRAGNRGATGMLERLCRIQKRLQSVKMGGRIMHRVLGRAINRLENFMDPGSRSPLLMKAARDSGLFFEATEVMRCLREGELQSPIMSHAGSLEVHRTLDSILAQMQPETTPTRYPSPSLS